MEKKISEKKKPKEDFIGKRKKKTERKFYMKKKNP